MSTTHGAGADPHDPDRAAQSAGASEPGRDRRTFLRQLSGDAIVTAGKLAGASAVLRRSLVAAGEAAVEHVEGATANESSADHVDAPLDAQAPDITGAAAPDTADPVARQATRPPDPVVALTSEQHAFLTNGTRAVLAVNDPGGHPLVASAPFHWDGSIIRLPARDATARVADIDRDPRVSLLIDDPASDAWVAVGGMASLVYGAEVEPDIQLILAKYHDEAEAARRWDEMRSAGDQMAIRVRPTRFVWRGS